MFGSANPFAPQTPKIITPGSFRLNKKQKLAMALIGSGARHTLGYGGSRSGKTFLFVRAIVLRGLKAPNSRHVIFRHRFNACRAAVWLDTFPAVMRKSFPGIAWQNKRQEGYAVLPNGSEIWFAGLDDEKRVEKILGMEFATIYFNECSQIVYSSVVLAWSRLAQQCPEIVNKVFYDLNPVGTSHWTYRLFVEKKDPVTGNPIKDPEQYQWFVINPKDNEENLADGYVQVLEAMPEKQRKRFLDGRYVSEIEGALWTLELLARQRIGREEMLPPMSRIVVAVDPSGCKGKDDKRSDEVGIAVCGRHGYGGDARGYLTADLSGRYKPEDWASLAVRAYYENKADCIVGEINYGGDMVRATIHGKDPNVPFKMVTATRGKVQRAEPISQLYEMGRIHHVGDFPTLEEQLCEFSVQGYLGAKSPDRADAAIWGLTELLLGTTDTGLLQFYEAEAHRIAAEKAKT